MWCRGQLLDLEFMWWSEFWKFDFGEIIHYLEQPCKANNFLLFKYVLQYVLGFILFLHITQASHPPLIVYLFALCYLDFVDVLARPP